MSGSARQALWLRALALQLSSGPCDSQVWASASRCSSGTWQLFLRAERCAIPLEQSLQAHGRLASLAAEVRAIIRQHVVDEQTRVLSARSQLQHLGRIAAAEGWRPAVLKGGLCAVQGDAPVDLTDVDILLPPGPAEDMAHALDTRGYRAIFSTAQHLGARILPGGLAVEVHLSLESDGTPPPAEVWAGLAPIAGYAGLYRLSPADHLWHVLRHAVVDHPNRRGRIRDLLVIADAVTACGPEELAHVQALADRHDYAPPLREVLAVALSIAGGTIPHDPFRSLALGHYSLRRVIGGLPVSAALARDLAEWTFALLLGQRECRALWRHQVWQETLDPSPYRFIAWMERRVPRLGRAWRIAVRTAYRTALVTCAVPIACVVRVMSTQT